MPPPPLTDRSGSFSDVLSALDPGFQDFRLCLSMLLSLNSDLSPSHRQTPPTVGVGWGVQVLSEQFSAWLLNCDHQIGVVLQRWPALWSSLPSAPMVPWSHGPQLGQTASSQRFWLPQTPSSECFWCFYSHPRSLESELVLVSVSCRSHIDTSASF